MTPCLRLLLPAGLMLLLLGTFAAACASDDELTLEEFYEQASAITDNFAVQLGEVSDSFPDDGEETAESLQAEKAAYSEFAPLYDDFYDELETLNPPSEAAAEFDALLAAGRDVVEYLEGFADQIEEVESFTELRELLDENEAVNAPLDEGYRAACQSLQEVADTNNIVAEVCG